MRKRGFPPLEDRFQFFGDGTPAADRSALGSSIFEVEDRNTGAPFNLKLWRKTGTANDDDLRELWLHEMRQIQRIGVYEVAREVIVDVVDLVEDETSFGILLRQAGLPLASRMARAAKGHWLKSLANRQARALFWRNMARIAKAIGIVHLHGLVHGRIDASAVMSEGGNEPDFLLGGFEWSLWFSAGEDEGSRAKLSTHAAARADKHYSFEEDWRSFGTLIADCLGVRIEPSGDIVLPDGADASFVDSSERSLLRRLFVPTRFDVNDATSVGRAIRDIVASTPHTRTVGDGTFVMAVLPRGGSGSDLHCDRGTDRHRRVQRSIGFHPSGLGWRSLAARPVRLQTKIRTPEPRHRSDGVHARRLRRRRGFDVADRVLHGRTGERQIRRIRDAGRTRDTAADPRGRIA
jgi:hypothetical protein